MNLLQVISFWCLVIICKLFGRATSVKLISAPISKNNPPVITLSGYLQADTLQIKAPDNRFASQAEFQNDFISKNRTEYIVTDEVTQVVFSCVAAYPIKLTFPHIERVPYHMLGQTGISEYRLSSLLPGAAQPSTSSFISTISFRLQFLKFLSVNLTCKSAEILPEKRSSVYIYLDGKNFLEHEGETIQISHNLNSKQGKALIIPCRPSLPDLELLLEMQYPGAKKPWQAITNWKFDPKVGFMLPDIKNIGNITSSFYRCSVVENNADSNSNRIENSVARKYVHVNVTYTNIDSTNTDLSSKFQPISNLKGRASVTVVNTHPKGRNIHPLTQIKCCSGVPQRQPILFWRECYNPLQCKLQQYSIPGTLKQFALLNQKVQTRHLALNTNGCIQIALNFPSMFLVCQDENVNFREHYTSLFKPGIEGSVANRSLRVSTKTKHSQSTSLTKYFTDSENFGVAQKMMIFVGRPVNGSTVLQTNGPKLGAPIRFSKQQNLAQLRKKIVNRAQFVKNNLNQVVEYDRDTYYVGEPLVFLCVGVKVFYAMPAHLSLNWANGSVTKLEAENNLKPQKPTKVFYLSGGDSMFGGNSLSVEYSFSKPILAELEMKSVDCWMPVVESSKWEKISKRIKVLRSVPPLFQEPQEETVYFYLGDNNHVVSCTVIASLPQAMMTVYKNDKKLKLPWRKHGKNITEPGSQKLSSDTEFIDMNKHRMTVRLKYKDIKYGHEGVVKCIARNVNKTVTRTVHVYVISKSNIALHISLSVVGILSLAIIGLGAVRLRYKRSAVN